MRRNDRSRSVALSLGCMVFILSAGFFSRCSSPVKPKPGLSALFDEGRSIFFNTVTDEVMHHPKRGSLNSEELSKIQNLRNVYPRLYGILVNYYYQKEAPAFTALMKDGREESMRRFETMYRKLAEFSAHMFVECLFNPSAHGSYFKDLLPRFKGKDLVDIATMSTGNMAKLSLPSPDEIKPKTLSPEFEKQWGLDAARFRGAHKLAKGRGVRIAVLDSGVDRSHPVFRDTHWGSNFNFVGRDGFPWKADGPPMVDWGWHGTVVSSIVATYAPEATITLYRYLDADTQNDSPVPLISSSLMGAAIYKAVHDGNDVINLSAGTNLYVPYLQKACQYAYDNNVVFVTGSPYYMGLYLGENEDYPGQFPTSIAVTGIDRLGENKYGYWDKAAPEPTTDVGSPCAPFVAYPTYVNEKDDYAPGISCAIPIVTSLVGLVESVYPRLGTEPPGTYVETIRRLLIENANPRAVGFDGYSPECGYGLIDAEKTVQAAIKLAAARPALAPSQETVQPASPSPEDRVFEEGRKAFYQELNLALGLCPEQYRLLPSEIDRLKSGAQGVPFLYEDLVNILFCKDEPELQALRQKNDLPAFEEKYEELCRDAAHRFVDSLFCESPRTEDLLQAGPNLGHGRLDLVLASLGLSSPADSARAVHMEKLTRFAEDRVLKPAGFSEAQKQTTGQGLKIAIIDSGCAFDVEALKRVKFDHAFDFSLIQRTQSPWSGEAMTVSDADGRGTLMTLIASVCAPGAEFRIYRIRDDRDWPYEYWPAMELAQAIYKAAQDGNDIIVTGAAFRRDFAFLKEACQSAYFRNVIIVAPNGPSQPEIAEGPPAYPAAYNSVIALAGAAGQAGNRLVPWAHSAASKSTAVTAVALVGPMIAPSNAYAASAGAGLAALISQEMPKNGKELPGQYVQRIAEIMKKSANPGILGFRDFNPKIGYGLIDAPDAIGPEIKTYTQKMKALEEYFNKRMAQIAKEAEEETAQKGTAKKSGSDQNK
jgi:hypothetical protein